MTDQLELFPELVERNALDEARDIIYSDREQTHGHPARNFRCIADMWTAYLNNRFRSSCVALSPEDVCVMMGLMKSARFAANPSHRDNIVDAIGYWASVERCRDKV